MGAAIVAVLIGTLLIGTHTNARKSWKMQDMVGVHFWTGSYIGVSILMGAFILSEFGNG